MENGRLNPMMIESPEYVQTRIASGLESQITNLSCIRKVQLEQRRIRKLEQHRNHHGFGIRNQKTVREFYWPSVRPIGFHHIRQQHRHRNQQLRHRNQQQLRKDQQQLELEQLG